MTGWPVAMIGSISLDVVLVATVPLFWTQPQATGLSLLPGKSCPACCDGEDMGREEDTQCGNAA